MGKFEAMSDEELRAEVAKALGWEFRLWRSTRIKAWFPPNSKDPKPGKLWSTEIAAAWEVIPLWNEAHGDFELRMQNGIFHATFFRPSEEFEAWEKTAPRAICIAFLKSWEAGK